MEQFTLTLMVLAGQIPFHSRTSGRQEYLPVCLSVTGAPGNYDATRGCLTMSPDSGNTGTDLALIDMIQGFLTHTGRPTTVLTGRMMFTDTADRI